MQKIKDNGLEVYSREGATKGREKWDNLGNTREVELLGCCDLRVWEAGLWQMMSGLHLCAFGSLYHFHAVLSLQAANTCEESQNSLGLHLPGESPSK